MFHKAYAGLAGFLLVGTVALAAGPAAVPGEKAAVSGGSGVAMTTVAPIQSETSWRFEQNLRFGMRNHPGVSDLQEFLTDQGFYAGPVSGNFFLLTMQAVKKFQSAHGLPPTGYFGTMSRAKANEILAKLVDFICPQEEGCTDDILPYPSLVIGTESSLTGNVGQHFQAVFKVSVPGYYELNAEGEIPGLSWTRSGNCLPSGICTKDLSGNSITITGVPTQAGIYQVTVVANGGGWCPPESERPCLLRHANYGKGTFTIFIRGEGQTGAPVIHGVKGPTRLKAGEEGTWTIQASDRLQGSLSYSVRWGDEFAQAEGSAAPRADAMPFFRQTATFSHKYARAGEYKVVFQAANERGQTAETSLTVLVGGGTTGSVSIQALSRLAGRAGESFGATFEAKGGTPPYKWSVTAGALPPGLELVYPPMPMYYCPELLRCPMPVQNTIMLSGVPTQAGTHKFTLTATDVSGNQGSNTFWMEVSGESSQGTLSIQPDYASIAVGGTVRMQAMYQSPMPPCPPGMFCAMVMPAPIPVEVEWSVSDPNVLALEREPIQCITAPCISPVIVRGVRAGAAAVNAIYRTPAGILTAYAKVSVGETVVPMGQ